MVVCNRGFLNNNEYLLRNIRDNVIKLDQICQSQINSVVSYGLA
jgi:hypothetical protein